MCEDDIPIDEKETDDPNTRKFVPVDDVSWEFEITVETTPYEVDEL